MSSIPLPWRGFDQGEPEYRRITLALFFAGFATFALVFDAQAVLPAIGADFGIDPSAAALTLSAATIGLAASVLPWAWLADRLGRAKAMQISLSIASLLGFLAPLMPTFEAVVVTRALLGLALGAVPAVGFAYLTEELALRRVSIAAGIFIAGNTFGGIAGRLIAGPLSETVGWRPALLAVGVLALASAIGFLVAIPPARGFQPFAPQPYSLRTRITFQLRDPMMLGLYAQGFLLMGSFGAIYNYFGYHVQESPFLVPPTVVSLIFVAYLAGTASSRLSASFVGRFGHLRVILFGISTMVVGLALMLVPSLVVVIVGFVIFTIGTFSAHPVASGLTGQRAQLGRAQATALYQLSWLAGTSFFGWLAGVVFVSAGWTFAVLMVALMCAASGIIAVVSLRVFAGRRPLPPRRDN